ncbi:MAG TPA: hypothetical protein VIB79_03505 [Candidatus Binatia bacterium]
MENTINASDSVLLDQVKTELQKPPLPRSSLENLRMLAASLIIFAGLGLFQQSLSGIAILVVVLFIHEMGHLIGMKIFGYRDVQMFFIPFFGAAVSGVQKSGSSTQQAIVSLLGPVPGIVLGVGCAILFFRTSNELYAEAASSLLFINGFNLLPFHPLDGGRVLESLLFSRNAKIEVGFKLVTGIMLLMIGFFLHSMLLTCFAIFALLSLSRVSAAAKVAAKIKDRIEPSELSAEAIPERQIDYAVDELKNKFRGKAKDPKMIAELVREIWQRARIVPPSIKGTAGILAVYLPFVVIGLLAPFVFEAGKRILQGRTELTEVRQEDGSYRRVQLKYVDDQKVMEVPVNEAGLYHGLQTEWHPFSGEKRREGAWKSGFRDGEWKSWDREGHLQSVTEYRMGRLVRYATMKTGTLVDASENEWPSELRSNVQSLAAGPGRNKSNPNGIVKTAVEPEN